MNKLIDTHAHLNNSSYRENTDWQKIIDSMEDDGLSKIISVSYDLEASRKNFEIAKNNKNVFFSVGVHPSYSKSFDITQIDELFKLSCGSKCVAIGEMGLDYHYPDTDKDSQKFALLSQLDLVERTNLPAIFHLRDAYDDMLDIIEKNKHKIKNSAVMHCYSGDFHYAKKFLDLGYYISFTGAITYKNSHLPELLKFIPHDRILVETDCPYLSPMPFRGKLNYPKHVNLVAQKIAEVWELDLEYVKKVTTANALKLFKKMQN